MNTLPPCKRRRPASVAEAGIALLLCLLLLTSLTLIGLSAASEALMQGKLADNLQEAEQARQSALAAQEWAEDWLLALGEPPPSCPEPCVEPVLHAPGFLPADPETRDLAWWQTIGHRAGFDPVTAAQTAYPTTGSTSQYWMVEALHEAALANENGAGTQAWYRVLARGSGRAGTGVAVVESIVTRPWMESAAPPAAPQGNVCAGASGACGRVAWRSLR